MGGAGFGGMDNVGNMGNFGGRDMTHVGRMNGRCICIYTVYIFIYTVFLLTEI